MSVQFPITPQGLFFCLLRLCTTVSVLCTALPAFCPAAISASTFLLMALRALPEANRDLVNVVVGALGTAWISIIGYYFGTSAGSMRKTELLAQPSVPITPETAVTLRDPAPASGANGDSAHRAFVPGGQGPIFTGAS